jgi:hypothetical protein
MINPLSWKRNHLAALLAFCVAGALGGLAFSWFDSPFYALCRSSISGEWSNCARVLLLWLPYPEAYWPMMVYGALVPGLIFYGLQLARH